MQATLFIFSGLPASGKSTLAKRLAAHTGGAYLRIDTVEQALCDLCHVAVEAEGYRLSYRIAADNLQCGNSVVADSCNPIEITRREWEQVAEANQAKCVNIVICCEDLQEHRRRCEQRACEIAGLKLPHWEEVLRREYHPWSGAHVKLDTSKRSVEESFDELTALLEGLGFL